jgi:MarR family transcriptional regulator for hemolysin
MSKTTPPNYDLESSLGFLVYKVHQRCFAEFRHRLEPAGLTPQQFGVLALLYNREAHCQAALCERGAIDANTMVGLLDRLEAAGLVRRVRDVRDRRAYLVRITASGRRLFGRCVTLQRQAAARAWAGVTPAEQERLRRLLRKMLAHDFSLRRKDTPNAR